MHLSSASSARKSDSVRSLCLVLLTLAFASVAHARSAATDPQATPASRLAAINTVVDSYLDNEQWLSEQDHQLRQAAERHSSSNTTSRTELSRVSWTPEARHIYYLKWAQRNYCRLQAGLDLLRPLLQPAQCRLYRVELPCWQVPDLDCGEECSAIGFTERLRFGASPDGIAHPPRAAVYLPPYHAAFPDDALRKEPQQENLSLASGVTTRAWDWGLGNAYYFRTHDGYDALASGFFDGFAPINDVIDGERVIELWELTTALGVSRSCEGECPVAIRYRTGIDYCRLEKLGNSLGPPNQCVTVVLFGDPTWIRIATGPAVKPWAGFGSIDLTCTASTAIGTKTADALATLLRSEPFSLKVKADATAVTGISSFRQSAVLRRPLGTFYERLCIHLWMRNRLITADVSPLVSRQNSSRLEDYAPANPAQQKAYVDALKNRLLTLKLQCGPGGEGD
jgi:hypothetical protein